MSGEPSVALRRLGLEQSRPRVRRRTRPTAGSRRRRPRSRSGGRSRQGRRTRSVTRSASIVKPTPRRARSIAVARASSWDSVSGRALLSLRGRAGGEWIRLPGAPLRTVGGTVALTTQDRRSRTPPVYERRARAWSPLGSRPSPSGSNPRGCWMPRRSDLHGGRSAPRSERADERRALRDRLRDHDALAK